MDTGPVSFLRAGVVNWETMKPSNLYSVKGHVWIYAQIESPLCSICNSFTQIILCELVH